MKKLFAVSLVIGLIAGCTKDEKANDSNAVNIPSITIGTQTWTLKNLDVAVYNDGTPIPEVTDPAKWATLTTGAWCYFKNDLANGATYGKLYNWYAIAGIWNEASKTDETRRKKLAPLSYHIPTDNECIILATYLGGEAVAGGKMKEIGTNHWINNNINVTNSSGFTGLPGGLRDIYVAFEGITDNGFWWSSSKFDTLNALYFGLDDNDNDLRRNYTLKTVGLSVRCIKD
jgi:uncharacterized protein (TIGR02145 family)